MAYEHFGWLVCDYFKAIHFCGFALRSEICEIKIPTKNFFWLNHEIKCGKIKFLDKNKKLKYPEKNLQKFICNLSPPKISHTLTVFSEARFSFSGWNEKKGITEIGQTMKKIALKHGAAWLERGNFT